MDSLYSGSEGGKKAPESIDEENAEAMQTSATVPVKLLQGKGGEPVKVGDEIVVKVQSLDGDMATIVYAPKEGTEETTPGEKSPSDELDEMNEVGAGKY